MNIESIPNSVEAEAWSLATTVCQDSKIDSDQWRAIFPNLKSVLIQRWLHECQYVTDFEEQEWKDQIRREYRALASEKCEPAWRRFLYYKRCKHLRYLAILVSGAAVSYLCPQQTIYLLVERSQRLWGVWYFVSTFVVLICVPLMLGLAIGAKKMSSQRFVKRITAGILTLGLAVPIVLLLATLFWQLSGNVHEWSSWAKSFLAIPFCICGSFAVVAEVFQWTAKRPPHPLEVCLTEKSKRHSADGIREKIEQHLTQFALDVCRSSQMDDNPFQYDTAEDIHNSLYILWEDCVHEGADPQEALNDTLKNFGPIKNAGYTDDIYVRVLFYHRHRATRYLAMIGIGLFFVYLLLMTITGADVNERSLWLSR